MNEKQAKFVPVYFSYMATFDELEDEQIGRIVKALLHFGMTGEEPDFAPKSPERFVWPSFRENTTRALEFYGQTLSERRSEAGKKGAAARWGKDSDSTISEISGDAKPERAEYKILGAAKSQELLERFGGIAAV